MTLASEGLVNETRANANIAEDVEQNAKTFTKRVVELAEYIQWIESDEDDESYDLLFKQVVELSENDRQYYLDAHLDSYREKINRIKNNIKILETYLSR